MKFNPHSSPPPICRLIYSQVHSAENSEEAQTTNLETTRASATIQPVTVLQWFSGFSAFSSDFAEFDSYEGKVQCFSHKVIYIFFFSSCCFLFFSNSLLKCLLSKRQRRIWLKNHVWRESSFRICGSKRQQNNCVVDEIWNVSMQILVFFVLFL